MTKQGKFASAGTQARARSHSAARPAKPPSMPEIKQAALEVPVLDASGLLTGLTWPRSDFVRAMRAACEQWGFFQIINHGLPDELVKTQFSAAERFFNLPQEVKRACKRTPDNAMGFFDDELTKQRLDLKEAFDYGRPLKDAVELKHLDGINRWPDPSLAPTFKTQLTKYFSAMERVGLRLTEALALGLDLPSHALHPMMEKRHSAFCRLNFYPPAHNTSASVHDSNGHGPTAGTAATTNSVAATAEQDNNRDTPHANGNLGSDSHATDSSGSRGASAPGRTDEVASSRGQAWHEAGRDLGISPHSDAGFLTVLAQGPTPGLEVWHEGRWHLVRPIPGAFVVNVGDMCEVLTNGRYKAVLHRVLASGPQPRSSVAFFFNPSYESDVAPLQSCISPQHPLKYKPVSWGYYRTERFAGDVSDAGKEIQLDDYLVQN
ncbi:hypothetical protein WJX73_007718 [Symbiochloris irregularis]|uniref:Fe2OG dioxygenase domain-containing protein n=1 Tax=Symbiochloris irregularis TaxID=706552 RepID=A0AAW1P0F3_9CHLO